MLLIKCAACQRKLWRYDKVGRGELLRCHKARIKKNYSEIVVLETKVYCPCGKEIGIDKGTCFKMIAKAITYSGTKRPK